MANFATVAELEEVMGTTGLGARGTAMLGYASAEIRLCAHQDIEATAGRQEEFAGEWNRAVIPVTQIPITAVTSITVDAVAFTDFWVNYMSGDIYRSDGGYWTEGPIIVTYDSGFGPTSDEMAIVKTVCLEVAKRALAPGMQETFGAEIPEMRGSLGDIYLTEQEAVRVRGLFEKVTVG